MKAELSLTEELALLGLIAAKEKGSSPAELSALFKTELGREILDFAGALASLLQREYIEQLPRMPRSKSLRYRLLPAGRSALEERLGGALGTARNAKQKAVRTLVARRAFDLPAAGAAGLAGEETLLAFLLARELGETYRPGLTLKALAARVAAESLGATDTQTKTLWQTLLHRAVSSPEEQSAEAVEAADFADAVRRAAPLAREGWFGEKLFIHRAWEAWREEARAKLSLSEFKQGLLNASRAGRLSLARADFTATLPPGELDAAKLEDGPEIFHFIVSNRREIHP